MCSHHEERATRGCGCERPTHGPHYFAHHHYPGDQAARSMGIRRPLRFLAWRLELDESQVTKLATILNDLKTERAQSDVDDRRALALLADATQGEAFDASKATEAARLRTQSAERLQQKVVDSLRGIHEVLDGEQREKLAYLLRTGTLVM
jgi:Spy/CpxP family protein refolding chaperone